MRHLHSTAAALFLCLFLGRPAPAEDAQPPDPVAPMDPAAMQAQLDALSGRLAEMQARIDDITPDTEDQLTAVRKNKYGGSTDPALSGSYGPLFKDAEGFGLINKNGVALLMKMDLSLIETLPDNSVITVGFGPAWTPGAYPTWVVDDTDEEHIGLGTASRLGTLLGTFKFGFKDGPFDGTAGFQSFSTSIMTLSGPLSDRPDLFDKNPYMANITSKAYYENQFLTGVPKRSPEESEHYIMGLKTDMALPGNLTLMDFIGNFQSFYTDDTLPHEYGGTITWDKKDSLGGVYKFIGYNHSNDAGEMLTDQGTLYGYFGMMNNTVFGIQGDQTLGRTNAEFEVDNSRYDDSSGINGVHVDGQSWRVATETHLGDQLLRLGLYGISPDYLVTDPQGLYNNNGANLPRYREDPDHKGQIISQTVVADPSLPINDTYTYKVGAQFRSGNSFLNLKLQNSRQMEASDAQIWASHVEGGGNLNEGTWFVFFNNNYQSWIPPDGEAPGTAPNAAAPNSSAAYNTDPSLEREFQYNSQRSGPTPAFPTTQMLNAYDETYAPTNTNTRPANLPGGTPFVPGAIYDVNNKFLYNSFHDLETDMWRVNYEGVVNTNAQGQALAPSVKSISNATADLRMNLADYLPLQNRALYWQAYSEVLTVNDNPVYVPSLDPNNLFVQSLVDTTVVYSATDTVNLLLNIGMENWVTDRIATYFENNNGQYQNATLEYHDREAGVGLDWNFIPNKLNLYFRVKLLDHEDSFAHQNNFQARQMWWEMKSYF